MSDVQETNIDRSVFNHLPTFMTGKENNLVIVGKKPYSIETITRSERINSILCGVVSLCTLFIVYVEVFCNLSERFYYPIYTTINGVVVTEKPENSSDDIVTSLRIINIILTVLMRKYLF